MNEKTLKQLHIYFDALYNAFKVRDSHNIHSLYSEICGFCNALYSAEIITYRDCTIYMGEAFRVYVL